MSREQRQALDAKLRSFQLLFGTRSIQEVRDSIQEARDGYAALMSTMQVPDGFRTAEVELAGIRTLRIEPTGTPRPGTILFFHGGSFVVGSPETELGLTANLVVRTGYTAYSVDYRLAPEHPFPAGIDDTTAAYHALLEAGHDPASIAFAGDSAGGGLTITTLLRARQQGLPMPAAVVAFSPGLDNAGTGAELRHQSRHRPAPHPRERAAQPGPLSRRSRPGPGSAVAGDPCRPDGVPTSVAAGGHERDPPRRLHPHGRARPRRRRGRHS